MNGLKLLLLPLYRYVLYLKYFLKNYRKLPVLTQFWCLSKGFFGSNYILYGLNREDHKLYISDFTENFRASRINASAKILNNKLLFLEVARQYVDIPQTLGLIEMGAWVRYGAFALRDYDDLFAYVQTKGAVILKPIEGDGGEGIIKMSQEGEILRWNNEPCSKREVEVRLSKLGNYLISDVVEQHPYSSSIFSKSVNTIRILTMLDVRSRTPFIAAAAHRIGNCKSAPVDNCAKGGFTASIDLGSGVIGKAVKTYFDGDRPQWLTHHPDSGSIIENIQIPHWAAVKRQVLELADGFSFVPYIGWDLVLQPNGRLIVLEANDGPDLKLHQVHKPLLCDQKVRNFYRDWRVIN